jgi:K+-sensing histidine kinase KdpD
VPSRDVQESAVGEHLAFARRLHIETHLLEGKDVATRVVDFARENGVTQIFVAKPQKRGVPLLQKRPTAMRIVELAKEMQVTVVAERRPAL